MLSEPTRFAGGAVLYGTLPFDAGLATTPHRLDGVPVLVIHGEQDQVIPVELLARTWSYLHDDAGAILHAHRSPGGHELTVEDAVALGAWLVRWASPR